MKWVPYEMPVRLQESLLIISFNDYQWLLLMSFIIELPFVCIVIVWGSCSLLELLSISLLSDDFCLGESISWFKQRNWETQKNFQNVFKYFKLKRLSGYLWWAWQLFKIGREKKNQFLFSLILPKDSLHKPITRFYTQDPNNWYQS